MLALTQTTLPTTHLDKALNYSMLLVSPPGGQQDALEEDVFESKGSFPDDLFLQNGEESE